MYIMDYHVHSTNSFDGKSKINDICRRAVQKGIKEICFTEHFSVDPVIPTYGYINLDSYSKEIEENKNLFKDKLVIKKGLEICEPHLNYEKLQEELNNQELDFIIGSVHNINKTKLRKYIQGKNNKDAYRGFFKEVYLLACSSNIDIIGHLDLLKRYAYNDLGNYKFLESADIIEAILKKVIERNIGIEINTSGFRSDVKEMFPSVDVLKMYKSLGGEIITIGSDSHSAELVGEDLNNALDLLKYCGFRYIFKYNRRKPEAIKI
ncbi:histidinol-phosphatase HisJ family protein [Haloimpatiens sp. FM7330]|uniref:histidinol-phosphatase HisJ family protein n=1 Tax=Haloimpatiens sp. FM7330 TaxID=3298610 RepID=UPI0036261A75